MLGMLVIFAGIGLYLLPTLIAIGNRHTHTASIAVINIFLGWTFLGWVICASWAVSQNNRQLKNGG
jgi:hypothetical protein